MTDFTVHLREQGSCHAKVQGRCQKITAWNTRQSVTFPGNRCGLSSGEGRARLILTPPMSSPSTAAGRVLIVEDDPDIAHLLSHSLNRAGFGVETLTTGHEVMAAVRRQRPDLVLLDLMLPGLDGLEVCRSLRGDPLT